MSDSISKSGNGNGGISITPPQGFSYGTDRNSQVVSGGSSSSGVRTSINDWHYYADSSGKVTSPPNYPDVSYLTFLTEGGNLLGIGYYSWRDRRLAAYDTAMNLYKQYYESAAQQVSRLEEAGLNTNLGYSLASPGSGSVSPHQTTSSPSPDQVFFGGIGAVSSLAGGIKTLAEAATIINELPDSKLKGNIARMIDAGAKAGAINAENTYQGSLFSARNALGVGSSKAQAEKAEAAFTSADSQAKSDLIDYLTTHGENGEEASFESSLYTQSDVSSRRDAILNYKKHRKEWDELLSKPEYYQGLLDKAVGQGQISKAQGQTLQSILDDPNMDSWSKFMAIHNTGLTGFFSKLTFGLSSGLVGTGKKLKIGLFGEDWIPFNHR